MRERLAKEENLDGVLLSHNTGNLDGDLLGLKVVVGDLNILGLHHDLEKKGETPVFLSFSNLGNHDGLSSQANLGHLDRLFGIIEDSLGNL